MGSNWYYGKDESAKVVRVDGSVRAEVHAINLHRIESWSLVVI